MGWCGGSYLAEEIYKKIQQYIVDENKMAVAKIMVKEFNDYDADCWEDDMEIIKASES